MAITKGTWGIGGFKLPDLGLTEMFAKPTGSTKASTFYNPAVVRSIQGPGAVYNTGGTNKVNNPISPAQLKQINKQNVPKTNTDSTGGSSGGGQPQSSTNQPDIFSPNQNIGDGPSETDVINNEFNAFNSMLDAQAGTAQTNFNDTKALYDTTLKNNTNQLKTDRTQQTEGIAKNESLNLAKVRQLLADLAQKDAARTSITGGGSVSEALGERFGRQAQSNLGNVVDQSQQAIERVNTFYNNSISKLQDTYNSNILNAKQTLDQNLSNIQQAKTDSGIKKQQASLNAWKEYYNNVNQAKIQAATFKAQYDLWKNQQDSALSAAAGFNASNLNTYNTGLNQSYGVTSPAGNTNSNAITMNPNYTGLFSNDTNDEKKNLALYGTTIAPITA